MELVTDGNAKTRTDLILPLARHNLSVGARDLDASVEAGSVVCVGNDSSKAVVGTDRAVVRSLGSGITIVRPSKGPGRELGLRSDKGVLLLNAIPGLFLWALVEDALHMVAEVGVGRHELLTIAVLPSPSLGHHELVVALAEGIPVHCHGLHDDLGVVSGGLVAGGSVVVPLGKVSDRVDLVIDGTTFGAESDSRAVDPDVLKDHLVADFVPSRRVVAVLVVERKMIVIHAFSLLILYFGICL